MIKKLDLTNVKYPKESLEEMKRISENVTVVGQCYSLLDLLSEGYPESLDEVMTFLQDCLDFYSENAEYEKSKMELIEQNLPLEIF